MENTIRSEEKRLTRAAGVVSFFTLLSRILGLVRDMVIATLFGAGMYADAFFVAFRIPNLMRRLFAEGSLTISFIPIFTEHLQRDGKVKAFYMARSVMWILVMILALVSVLGILLAPLIVRVQAWGFIGDQIKYALTVDLTRITFPYIFFISLVAFFMGILNSLGHFGAPASAPILLNLGIIGSALLISPHLSIPVKGLAMGVLLGGIMQLLLQVPWLIKKGFSFRFYWNPKHPAIKRIGILMLPAIFGSAIYQVNIFVSTLLASFLREGSISWLYYADRLVQFPLGVFAIAISTASLPSLSRQGLLKEGMQRFKDTLNYSLRMVLLIAIPSSVGLIIVGKTLIILFFERGAFDPLSTDMTYRALIFYSLGLCSFSIIRILVSAFYSIQDTKTPVKIASLAFAFNLLFSLLLMRPLGHGGLALSLSLSSTIQALSLAIMLKKKIGIAPFTGSFMELFKYLASALCMGILLLYLKIFLKTYLSMNSILMLFVLVISGALIYVSGLYLLRCRGVEVIAVFRERLFKIR